MARVYEQYITGVDRDIAIMEAENNLFEEKVAFMLETIERERELNKKMAEYMVLKESGTYDDLMYLYEEADKEADTKKAGVFETIINAIKNIFASIGRAFSNFGKKAQETPDEEVEIDKPIVDGVEKVKSVWAKNSTKGVVVGVGALFLALVGGHFYANSEDKNGQPNKVKMKLRDVESKINQPIKKIQDAVAPYLDKIPRPGKKKDGDANADQNTKPENNSSEPTDVDVDGTKVKNEPGLFSKVWNALLDLLAKVPVLGGFLKKDDNAEANGSEPQNQPQQNNNGQQVSPNNTAAQNNAANSNWGTAAPSTESAIEEMIGDPVSDAFIESVFGDMNIEDDLFEESLDSDIDEIFDSIFE